MIPLNRGRGGRGNQPVNILPTREFGVLVRGIYPCTESKNGCSNASAIQRKKRAASAPSINR